MSASVIIPARYASTRFPGKPLALINGKPMIQRVYEAASQSKKADMVVVATDDERILKSVRAFGGTAILTSHDHKSGSDRVAEVAGSLQCDILVNVQGDEPLLKPEMIDLAIDLLKDNAAEVGTLKKKITDPSDIFNLNVVKVVTDADNFALYFSRSPIPCYRDYTHNNGKSLADTIDLGKHCYFKHIGIYSYRKEALLYLSRTPPSPLEEAEKLEQLRALYNNIQIKVGEILTDVIGVDSPEDVERVEKWLNTYS